MVASSDEEVDIVPGDGEGGRRQAALGHVTGPDEGIEHTRAQLAGCRLPVGVASCGNLLPHQVAGGCPAQVGVGGIGRAFKTGARK
ncbi:hypothetical protein D3C81_1793800 [compost metagenome]